MGSQRVGTRLGIEKNGIDEPIGRKGTGDADVENGLVDTVGEGERGTSGESSINTYTPSHVKRTAGEKLPHNTASSAWHSDDVEGWGGRGRGEGGYVYNYG